MAGSQRKFLEYSGIRGRDGSTASTFKIPDYKALEAVNVDFYRASLGRKRGGADDVFASTTGETTTGIESALIRHVPGNSETAAELWKVNDAATPIVQRLTGGTVWASPTLKDNIETRPMDVTSASFNGKLYLAFNSTVDRLHVWDPTSAEVRRTGLATPAAATVANTGAGTYAATQRWYKVVYTEQRSGSAVRRSELSAFVAFTPSGTGTAARVTKPAAITEGETHWELYGAASEAGPYYLLATTVVGTTTYDDSAAPSSYSNNAAAPTVGKNTGWTSARYLISDGNHLLGAGSWETGGLNNTVWVSPVLGTTSSAFFDDEVVPTGIANKVEFDENDGGFITGLAGPLENQIIVLKYRQLWRMIATGAADRPYRRKPISKVVGCIRQQAAVMAEDDAGNPALYFLSHKGPYRLGVGGLEFLGRDVQDLWDTVNLAASNVTCHGVYHADKHQVWWWIATGANNDPDTKLVFDTELGKAYEDNVVRDGWAEHGGASATARCSVMFSNTLGASMSRDLKPHIGQSGASGRLWKCDTTATDDAGTAFQASLTFADRHFAGLHRKCQVFEPIVLGSAGSHTIRASFSKDYGLATHTADVTMTADGSETRVAKAIEAGFTGDAKAVAVTIGDASAVASSWTLDALSIPYEVREHVSA